MCVDGLDAGGELCLDVHVPAVIQRLQLSNHILSNHSGSLQTAAPQGPSMLATTASPWDSPNTDHGLNKEGTAPGPHETTAGQPPRQPPQQQHTHLPPQSCRRARSRTLAAGLTQAASHAGRPGSWGKACVRVCMCVFNGCGLVWSPHQGSSACMRLPPTHPSHHAVSSPPHTHLDLAPTTPPLYSPGPSTHLPGHCGTEIFMPV